MTSIGRVRRERLVELVSHLTGADPIDSAEATDGLLAKTGRDGSLAVVAHAIIELRESARALRVTPYLDRPYEPIIDLRADADDDASTDVDLRFRRHDRTRVLGPRSGGERPAGRASGLPPT